MYADGHQKFQLMIFINLTKYQCKLEKGDSRETIKSPAPSYPYFDG